MGWWRGWACLNKAIEMCPDFYLSARSCFSDLASLPEWRYRNMTLETGLSEDYIVRDATALRKLYGSPHDASIATFSMISPALENRTRATFRDEGIKNEGAAPGLRVPR